MKRLSALDSYRDVAGGLRAYGRAGDDFGGCFRVKSPTDPPVELVIVASVGMGWDHVSVSTARRTPNWTEMEHVKRLFFETHETAMQLHVPPAAHISVHEHCLHIWRPNDGREIPMPPPIMVAPAEKQAS